MPKRKREKQLPLMPEGLSEANRERYELLSYYLAEIGTKVERAERKSKALAVDLTVWRAREERITAQLLTMQPELEPV